MGRALVTGAFLLHQVPAVTVIVGGSGNGFGAVDGRAAAYGKQYVDAFLLTNISPLVYRSVTGIGLYARKFENGDSGFFQYVHHFVIQTDAFDGTATVSQQHTAAVLFDFLCQMGELVFTEVNLRCVLKYKIIHVSILVKGLRFCYLLSGFNGP